MTKVMKATNLSCSDIDDLHGLGRGTRMIFGVWAAYHITTVDTWIICVLVEFWINQAGLDDVYSGAHRNVKCDELLKSVAGD